jgi:hypothetical protein
MKWHKKTIDFFVDMEEANGWSHTSYRILQYLLADQIDYSMNNKIPLEDLFKDLTEQVENKINEQLYNEI